MRSILVQLVASVGLRAERLREKIRKEEGRDPVEVAGFTYDDGRFDAFVDVEQDLRRNIDRLDEGGAS